MTSHGKKILQRNLDDMRVEKEARLQVKFNNTLQSLKICCRFVDVSRRDLHQNYNALCHKMIQLKLWAVFTIASSVLTLTMITSR